MNNDHFDMDVVNNFFEHDYHDRGMVKWQGFYLSDHTAALNKQEAKDQKVYHPKSQQSLETITAILAEAYQRHRAVSLQLNELDANGNQLPDIQTHVYGYHSDKVIIDDEKAVSIDDIRHVEHI